jgi:hypothetical protein
VSKDLTIELDEPSKKRIERLLKRISPQELMAGILSLFDEEAAYCAGHVIKTQLSGQKLGRRTGTLARSVVGSAVRHGPQRLPAMRIGIFRGPALKYAAIHEYGGTILPKPPRKALAIPQKAALTPAGVEKFGGPRHYPSPLRFLPFRRGVAVGKLVEESEAQMWERMGLSPYNAETIYLLVRQVEITAKYWLKTGVTDYMPALRSRISEFLVEALSVKNS